jgi:hypothetical protein
VKTPRLRRITWSVDLRDRISKTREINEKRTHEIVYGSSSIHQDCSAKAIQAILLFWWHEVTRGKDKSRKDQEVVNDTGARKTIYSDNGIVG